MWKRVITLLFLILSCSHAWAFDFIDTQGNHQRLSDYKGKWVLVNFWATWCPPCRAEIPDLIALNKQYSKTKLVIIGIAMEYNDPKEVKSFARNMQINYPIVMGSDDLAQQVGQVEGLPTTYLYNPEGKIVAYQIGALTQQTIESYINSHGNKKKP